MDSQVRVTFLLKLLNKLMLFQVYLKFLILTLRTSNLRSILSYGLQQLNNNFNFINGLLDLVFYNTVDIVSVIASINVH